jgi:hypothetical protein
MRNSDMIFKPIAMQSFRISVMRIHEGRRLLCLTSIGQGA